MTKDRNAQSVIKVNLVDPTYGWGACGGGGKATNKYYCGNTIKFNPEALPFGKCPACGVIWLLSDDNETAESTFDEAVYANVSMIEFARTGRASKPNAI